MYINQDSTFPLVNYSLRIVKDTLRKNALKPSKGWYRRFFDLNVCIFILYNWCDLIPLLHAHLCCTWNAALSATQTLPHSNSMQMRKHICK